jgi:DNA-binding transcriptional ArsR family regulator
VKELARPFGLAWPTISKPLAVLARARRIETRKEASRRHCRLRSAALKEASDWIQKYTLFWQSTLDSLEEFATHTEILTPWHVSRSGKRK